jgi:hypothetical protein
MGIPIPPVTPGMPGVAKGKAGIQLDLEDGHAGRRGSHQALV